MIVLKGWMSTVSGERLFKNYEMYNKNDELTGQNCICIEEDMVTFFSTIKEGTGSAANIIQKHDFIPLYSSSFLASLY